MPKITTTLSTDLNSLLNTPEAIETFNKIHSTMQAVDTNALDAQHSATSTRELTPGFKRVQVIASESFASQAKSTAPTSKVVFIAGGLAGSGKTTHLKELIEQLTLMGRFVKYLDKDVIGSAMPTGTTSQQIYAEMIVRAEEALKTHDVIIMEGNTIGNLSCFTDFIREQDAKGVLVTCLDFICSNAQQQFDRITARAMVDAAAAERDKKKLQSFEYYFGTDRLGEIKRHDDQLAKNKDLIDNGILHLMVIETETPTTEPTVIANSVTKNVGLIVESMQQRMASEQSASEARRKFSVLPFAML